MIQAVLFDLIGTTVKEEDPDTINNCFEEAFADNQITVDKAFIRENRGKDKADIIALVVKSQDLPGIYAHKVYDSFIQHVENNIDNFSAEEDAAEVFLYLKSTGVKVGLGSGLSRSLFEKIVGNLHWDMQLFDYIGISHELGKSRPDPAMIFDMMNRLKIFDPGRFLKVGDTVADIREGKNATVLTAVVLSGTQDKCDLEREYPDFVITCLTELRNII